MEKKLLDLNAYGVSEMSSADMCETNGGIWILALFYLATRLNHPTGHEVTSVQAMMSMPI